MSDTTHLIALTDDERELVVFACGYYVGAAMRDNRPMNSEVWEAILRKFGVIYADE